MRRLQRELVKEVEIRRKAEEELRFINAGKDRFFNIIAHDLKNPMYGAISFSETMLEAVLKRKDPELQEIAETVHEATNAVGRLLLDLLAWAEIQMNRIEVEKEMVDFGELLGRNVSLAGILARQKQITLVNNAQAPVKIYADGRMIETVVRNLLSNAVKFTSVEGRIEIGVRSEKGEATVSIADTGMGIGPEKLAGLFQVGQSTSTYGTIGESGTGLGLLLCKEMIEKNGGRIWAESKQGKGSTFFFTVPTSAPAGSA